MNIRLPQGYVRAMLYFDVIILVGILGIIAYQPRLLLILFIFIYAPIANSIACFYAWYRAEKFMAEFNREFGGWPNETWEYDHSKYPGLIISDKKFCLIVFSLVYFSAFIIVVVALIRGVSN